MRAYTSEEALAADEAADIAFLDMEMPGESGIRVGAWLMEKNPKTKIYQNEAGVGEPAPVFDVFCMFFT